MESIAAHECNEALKELLLWQTASPAKSFSMDAALEQMQPGICKQFGSVDAIPGVEGYLMGCELLAHALESMNREPEKMLVN